VVWRCYGYLGDKKMARQNREQLNTTATAFYYPENLIHSGYALMPQPPPYAVSIKLARKNFQRYEERRVKVVEEIKKQK